MTLNRVLILAIMAFAESSWAQLPNGKAAPTATGDAVFAFLAADGTKPLAYVASWNVSEPGTWFERVRPDEGIDITLSEPLDAHDALGELIAGVEARGEPWVAGQPTVTMTIHDITAAGGLGAGGNLAILPALHPGQFGKHGGESFQASDYPRWMPWSTARLIRLDAGRFLLIADNGLRNNWTIPRAYVVEPPADPAITIKVKGLGVRRRLAQNPYLKLPERAHDLKSAVQLGDQVFVSAGAGWIARLDTKRMMWANVWQPLGPVPIHIGADGAGLRGMVERPNGTYEEHSSNDGVNWTRVRDVTAPPIATGLWRFAQGAWYFLERRPTPAGVQVGALHRLSADGKWSVAYSPDASKNELIMDWSVSAGADAAGLTILTGVPHSRGGPFQIKVEKRLIAVSAK